MSSQHFKSHFENQTDFKIMTLFYTLLATLTGMMMIASAAFGCIALLLGMLRMGNTEQAIPFIDLRIHHDEMKDTITEEQTQRQFYMSITIAFFIWAGLMAHTTVWLIS